jgi:hypothetical protein
VFENRVPRGTFGPEREEVEGNWRKLHNEELHNFHISPHIRKLIKSLKWEETIHAYKT